MITNALIIAFVVVVLLVLVRAALTRHVSAPSLLALEEQIKPVDMPAFRNLIDPAEEDYLREHLPTHTFRDIQRQRMRSALEYVQRTAYNGALLLRVGEAARRDHNPAVAAAARELVNNALRLRLNAKLDTVVLYGRIAMPGARISVGRITDAYENLTQNLVRLARLQDPASAARVSAAV